MMSLSPLESQKAKKGIGYSSRGIISIPPSYTARRGASLKNPFIFLYVRKHLADGWSPEQIAGRLSLDHPHQHIDDETIYRYIYSPRVRKEKLWRFFCACRKER